VLDLVDGAPIFRAVNRAHTRLSGLTTAQVAGMTVREVFAGRQGAEGWERHSEAICAGRPISYTETLTRDGQERTFLTRLSPITGADGSVEGALGLMIETTSDTARDAAALEADARLGEMERFVSIAAHDLRAPMRHIVGLTDLLREELRELGGGKLELIELLADVGTKATALIEDVLSYAQAASAEPRREVFDLGRLCQEIFVILDPQAEHRLDHFGGWVEADDVAIQIVLRNLVDHAIKRSEGKAVEVMVRLLPSDRGQLRLAVTDNGPTIPDLGRALLEEGAFQNGPRFGLAGVQRLVRGRGGEISLAAPVAGGTQVTIMLPGRPVPRPAAA
ncbi:MAG: ATP-binding protein, partial [Pseudomonadota bacterium]